MLEIYNHLNIFMIRKCIGCILSAVTYGKKGHNIRWGGLKYLLISRNELNPTEMFVRTHIY